MAIEIVDFPINSMVIFHCYVSSPEGIYIYNCTVAQTDGVIIKIYIYV